MQFSDLILCVNSNSTVMCDRYNLKVLRRDLVRNC